MTGILQMIPSALRPHLAGILPLLLMTPRLLRAWSQSRLDHLDWIFFLIFAAGLIVFSFWPRDFQQSSPRRHSPGGLCAALAALAGLLFGACIHMNALMIFFSILFWPGLLWYFRGWRTAGSLLPLFCILCLGIPGSSYWLGTLLGTGSGFGFILKIILSALCLGLAAGHRLQVLPVPPPETEAFLILLLPSLIFLWQNSRLNILDRNFTPSLPVRIGNFWGLETTVSPETRRFFASSQVRQYDYLCPGRQEINVLHIRCGEDIHEIHPASFCLRTTRWEIHSEKFLRLRDGFPVQEIHAVRHGAGSLIWIWYSSGLVSTPSFLSFRKNFTPSGGWQVYQLSIPVKDNLKSSRQTLQDFFTQLQTVQNHDTDQ